MFCALASTAYGEDEPLLLQLDRTFNVMPRGSSATPAFITARHMEGHKGNQLEAVGNAELHKEGQAIFAERLLYQQDAREVVADGAVRIEQNGDVITGSHLEYNLDNNTGEMIQIEYHFATMDGRGSAEVLQIEDKENYSLHNATYTTCPAGNNDWLLKMGELDMDRTTQIGVAHDSEVEFKGVPILYSPWMDFSLTGQRKTGFLAPELGSTSTGGTELTLPFYWNIAPNFDATIAPREIAKRGLQLNDDFRFLEPSYHGELQLDVLPQDRVANSTRIHEAFAETQNLGNGFSDSLNLNRVSDNAYYRDLSSSVASTSQVNLLREGDLNYSGGWWNATTRVQSFQTLQDPLNPIVVPYNSLPDVIFKAQNNIGGAQASFAGEYTYFHHPTEVNGQRLVLNPAISYPLLYDPGYYVTPKIGLHDATYVLGENNTGLPNTSVAVPIFSMDSGMTFERDTDFAGRDFIQTIEPRAFYVYIPYHYQDMLPVFDSALGTFSYSQMFTENRFLGNDRVGDANQITLAGTSRLLDGSSGAELLKIFLGERFSFTTPKVSLAIPTPTTPTLTQTANTNKSDILFGFSGKMSKALSFDTLLQYNPSGLGAQMYSVNGRYQPESGKVFNLGYRFSNPDIDPNTSMRQIDLSGQWQLYGRWGVVASWSYSVLEKELLQGMVGLEYNQSCWVARLVMQRITTALQQVSTGIFVQLDLNGLAGVGVDPLDALRSNIPGYTKLNQNVPGGTAQGLQ